MCPGFWGVTFNRSSFLLEASTLTLKPCWVVCVSTNNALANLTMTLICVSASRFSYVDGLVRLILKHHRDLCVLVAVVQKPRRGRAHHEGKSARDGALPDPEMGDPVSHQRVNAVFGDSIPHVELKRRFSV